MDFSLHSKHIPFQKLYIPTFQHNPVLLLYIHRTGRPIRDTLRHGIFSPGIPGILP